jgi:hypothetical protein
LFIFSDILMKADLGNINEEAIVTTTDSIDDESESASDMDVHSNASDQQQMSSTEEQDSTSSRRSLSPILLTALESTMLENDSDGSVGSEVGNWADEQKIDNYFAVSTKNGSDNWGPLTMLKKLINAYADIVSTQIACTKFTHKFRETAKPVLLFV